MNLRTGLTASALVPLVATWAIPDGSIPTWFRLALAIVGVILLILSFVPEAE